MKKIILAFMKTGMGTFINLSASLILAKLFALFLGTEGVGLFSVIRQTNQTVSTLACLNGSSAIIQGMNSKPENEKSRYIISCIIFMFLFATLISTLMLITAHSLALWVFHDAQKESIIYALAFIVWVSVAVSIGMSFLNGHMAIGRLAITTASGGLGLALTAYPTVLLIKEGFIEAFCLPLLMSSIFSLFTAWIMLKHGGYFGSLMQQKKTVFASDLKYFLKISGAMLASGFAAAVVLLVVRSSIIQYEGLAAAGFFAAAWALGIGYTTLVTNTFSTYYLPALTRSSKGDRDLLLNKMLRISMIILLPLIVFITLEKTSFIRILYSEDFVVASDILRWLLPCVYIQTTSRIFGMQMIASANMRLYLSTNIPFHFLFMLIVIYLLQYNYPLEWVAIAYFVTVVVRMLIVVPLLCWYYHMAVLNLGLLSRWLLGASVLTLSSWLTWSGDLSFLFSLLLMICLVFISLAILNNEERVESWRWLRKKMKGAA